MSTHFGRLFVQELASYNPFLPLLCDLDVSQNVVSSTALRTNIIASSTPSTHITFLADVDVSMNTINAAVLRAADIKGLTDTEPWLNFHTDLDVSNNVIRVGAVQTDRVTVDQLVVNQGLTSHRGPIHVFRDLDVSSNVIQTQSLAVTTLTGSTGKSSDRITILSDVFAAATLNYTKLNGTTVQAKNLTITDADGTMSLQSTGITFPDKTVQTTAFSATDTLVAHGGITTNAEVVIATARPGAAWTFHADGTLTYPDTSVQSTAYVPFLRQAQLSAPVTTVDGQPLLTLSTVAQTGDLITVSYAATGSDGLGLGLGFGLYVEVNGIKDPYSITAFTGTVSHTYTFQVQTTGTQNLALYAMAGLIFMSVQLQAYRN